MNTKQNKKLQKKIDDFNNREIKLPTDKEIYESDECLSYKDTDERLAFYNGAKFVLKHIENQ